MMNNMTQIIINHDGEAHFYKDFLSRKEASFYFEKLHTSLAWHGESIKIYGREVKVPRLVAWYGDPGAVYCYSGVIHEPLPWIPALIELRDKITAVTDYTFNSVLANLYRDQNDSMGWHSDKEKELGPGPVIASVSLGVTRIFKLQHNKTKDTVEIELASGSLLIMAGELQKHWRHCVPKVKNTIGPRINLTYRTILSPG